MFLKHTAVGDITNVQVWAEQPHHPLQASSLLMAIKLSTLPLKHNSTPCPVLASDLQKWISGVTLNNFNVFHHSAPGLRVTVIHYWVIIKVLKANKNLAMLDPK